MYEIYRPIGLRGELSFFSDQDALIPLARVKSGLSIQERAAIVSLLLPQLQYQISYAKYSSAPI